MQFGKIKRENLIKLKQCQYEGCTEQFEGNGITKYCPEHRKKEYRKKIQIKHENINQIINHKEIYCPVKMLKCSLDGCDKRFEIVLIPNINVYPKYCPEHRNEYKRKKFLSLHIN